MSVHSMMRSRDRMDKYQKEAIPTRGKPENITPKWGGGTQKLNAATRCPLGETTSSGHGAGCQVEGGGCAQEQEHRGKLVENRNEGQGSRGMARAWEERGGGLGQSGARSSEGAVQSGNENVETKAWG